MIIGVMREYWINEKQLYEEKHVSEYIVQNTVRYDGQRSLLFP